MFDGEIVAFLSGTAHIFLEVAVFSQVRPCSSSILRGDRTVSTVPGLCDSEIWRFTPARHPIVTCFRRVTVDFWLAFARENSKSQRTSWAREMLEGIFWTREAHYDFRCFPAKPKMIKNAPEARYECRPCHCKMPKIVLLCLSRCGAMRIFH